MVETNIFHHFPSLFSFLFFFLGFLEYTFLQIITSDLGNWKYVITKISQFRGEILFRTPKNIPLFFSVLFLSTVFFFDCLQNKACPFGRPGQNPGGKAATQRNFFKKVEALEHTFFLALGTNSWVTALPSMCQKQ